MLYHLSACTTVLTITKGRPWNWRTVRLVFCLKGCGHKSGINLFWLPVMTKNLHWDCKTTACLPACQPGWLTDWLTDLAGGSRSFSWDQTLGNCRLLAADDLKQAKAHLSAEGPQQRQVGLKVNHVAGVFARHAGWPNKGDRQRMRVCASAKRMRKS